MDIAKLKALMGEQDISDANSSTAVLPNPAIENQPQQQTQVTPMRMRLDALMGGKAPAIAAQPVKTQTIDTEPSTEDLDKYRKMGLKQYRSPSGKMYDLAEEKRFDPLAVADYGGVIKYNKQQQEIEKATINPFGELSAAPKTLLKKPIITSNLIDDAYVNNAAKDLANFVIRTGSQFWNKSLAEPIHGAAEEEYLGDKAYLIQEQRIKERRGKGQKLTSDLLTDEYNDIKRQLALSPAAREDEDLKKVEYKYQQKKAPLALEVKPAETVGEKTSDITAGIASFVTRLALLRKLAPNAPAEVIWEAENLATGGRPGMGAGTRALLGGIGGIPTGTATGKIIKTGAESGLFAGLTALQGGSTEDIIVSALVPTVFNTYSFYKQSGVISDYQKNMTQAAQDAHQIRMKRGVSKAASEAYLKADLRVVEKNVAKAKQTIYNDDAFAPSKEKWAKARKEALNLISQGGESAKRGNAILDFLGTGQKLGTSSISQQIAEARHAGEVVRKEKFAPTEQVPTKTTQTVKPMQPVKSYAETPIKPSIVIETAQPTQTPPAVSKPAINEPSKAAGIAGVSEKPPAETQSSPITKISRPDEAIAKTGEQAAPEPIPESQPVFDTSKVPITEVPVSKLKLSKDVPNFKESASRETGVVLGQQLEGSYERLGTAPIIVWERKNGDFEVVTGRHRLDLARRTGEQTLPAQIVRESEGFTKTMALTIDAESNIREGQGGVKDYAQYFKANPEITEESARKRGLLSRAKGESGFRIGKGAVDDVYAAFNAGKISDAKAAAIARGAPNSESAQLAALSKAADMSPDELENFTRILTRYTPSDNLKAKQGNLFGYDDTAINEAKAVAVEVGRETKNIKDRIISVRGALRKPDVARQMGLEFSDEGSIRKEVVKLEHRLDDLKRVSTSSELWKEMRQRAGLSVEGVKSKYQKDLLGRDIIPPISGTTGEFLNKEDYRLPEPDIEGQKKFPLSGGRETGATTLIPDIISEGITLGRKFINNPIDLISSAGKQAWRNIRRGRNVINTLGGPGKLIAKDLDEITYRVTKNTNNDRLDLKKAFAGLNSEQRQTVAKIINERIDPKAQSPKLVEKANEVRGILDRSMNAGSELGMTRKVKGKKIPLGGSGKAFPQVPNKAGMDFLNEAESKGLGSAKVFIWAQEQVQAGNYDTVDAAVKALQDFRDMHIRGLNQYLESERVELPEEYIAWDGANILPHLLERNWMTVEGIRQWGNDFARVNSRLEQIKTKYGSKSAKRVENFIATSFGKMSPASTEAQNISNIVRGYQYATKVGTSPITIWRNITDRFAKMLVITQNPKVIATTLKEYPPFINAFMDSAKKLEEKMTRAGAVFGHGAIAEGLEPGSMISELTGKPFSESEKGNQVFIALTRYHQLLKDIDTWQKRKGEDSVTTKLANKLGLAVEDPTKYRLQEHDSKILDALESGEPITDELINEALHYTVRDKAFPVILSTKPLWYDSHPLIKILVQFKTWPKEQLGMIWNDVAKYTVKTGDVRRLAGFVVGVMIAGELYNIARDFLYEKDESITSQFFKEDKHFAKAVMNDLLDGGVVGILADFTYGIYDWAAGPSVSTGRNIRDAAAALYKRPSLSLQAISRLIQQEVTPVRQIVKTFDKIDRKFINERNVTKDYFKVRDWAWQYKDGYLKPDMLSQIQGVADDLIYGKVRYKPGDNTLAYQMAARQIMVGDIKDAKAYFKSIINAEDKEFAALPEKERKEKRLNSLSTIERTMKTHYSPYGQIIDEKEADFLSKLPEKERKIAVSVQEQWYKNMTEALYSLYTEDELRQKIRDNTYQNAKDAVRINKKTGKPQIYGQPIKGQEDNVKAWREELERRKQQANKE